jgi:hypothetical protein
MKYTTIFEISNRFLIPTIYTFIILILLVLTGIIFLKYQKKTESRKFYWLSNRFFTVCLRVLVFILILIMGGRYLYYKQYLEDYRTGNFKTVEGIIENLQMKQSTIRYTVNGAYFDHLKDDITLDNEQFKILKDSIQTATQIRISYHAQNTFKVEVAK